MNIAHIGPPMARRGGPAGYMLQLSQAAERYGNGSAHHLTFPRMAPPTAVRRATRMQWAKAALRPLKRALLGPPTSIRCGRPDRSA